VITKLMKARAAESHSWAVSKTIQVDAKGAIKIAQKYGESLVCVRYRLSPDGTERITTIELELERVPVQKKRNPMVSVKIYPSETHLTAVAKSNGARYNAKTRLWRMTKNDAITMGIQERIASALDQI
jgi:hypothetical protein